MSNQDEKQLFLNSFSSPMRSLTEAVASGHSSNTAYDAFASATYGQSQSTHMASFETPVMRAIQFDQHADSLTQNAPAHQSAKQAGQWYGGLDTLSNKLVLQESVTESALPSFAVPPMPIFFSKATSFITNADARIVVDRVCGCFKRNTNVTFEFVPTECQLACNLSLGGQAFRFCVNLSQYQGLAQHLVEVQLMHGDRFAFNGFFHDLCDELGNLVQLRFSKRLPTYEPLARSQPINVDLALPQLASLAQDNKADVAREGALALAVLSIEAPVPLTTDVTNVVVSGAKSSDWEVSRCAALLLANVSASESSRDEMINDEILSAMSQLLRSEYSSHSVEIKRSVCTALLNLSQKHASRLSAHKAFRQMLAESSASSDPFVSASLLTVRERCAMAY